MALERTIAALDVAKKVAPSKVEYWMSRDIQAVLGYKRWENFEDTIQRARRACEKSGENPNDHFRQTAKMIEVGKRPF
jgi:DNA-damage-inducible protein D